MLELINSQQADKVLVPICAGCLSAASSIPALCCSPLHRVGACTLQFPGPLVSCLLVGLRQWEALGETGTLEEGRSLPLSCFACSLLPRVSPSPSGSGVSGGAPSGPHSCRDCLRAVPATMPLAGEQHAQAALPPSLVSKHLLPSWSFSSPLYSSISSQGL